MGSKYLSSNGASPNKSIIDDKNCLSCRGKIEEKNPVCKTTRFSLKAIERRTKKNILYHFDANN